MKIFFFQKHINLTKREAVFFARCSLVFASCSLLFFLLVARYFCSLLVARSTKFTGKHLRWDLFCNKVAYWRPATSLNTESGTGAFLWIFWNQYLFCKTSEGMPLKSKIFTGVSFRKILGFCHKRKRQLFYFEGTPS